MKEKRTPKESLAITLEELEFLTTLVDANEALNIIARSEGAAPKAIIGRLKHAGEHDWIAKITEARRPLREWAQQNAFNNKKKLTNC